jgi:hypothetical protein
MQHDFAPPTAAGIRSASFQGLADYPVAGGAVDTVWLIP